MANPGFRALFFGLPGSSAAVLPGRCRASSWRALLRPECFGDHCIGPILPVMAVLGALAGGWVGVKAARGGGPGAGGGVGY